MDLCNIHVLPAIVGSKNFNVGHNMQTSTKVLHTCDAYTFIGTIDFYHFILLSLNLTLPVGHLVKAKQNLLLHFLPLVSSD